MITLETGLDAMPGRARTSIQVREGALGVRREVFFEFEGPAAPASIERADFAVLAMLPYAMQAGEPLHCEGPVSADLLVALEECMDVWARWRPDLYRRIPLSAAEEPESRPPSGRQAIMCYSGGVDATFALHAHKRYMLGRRTLDIRAGVMIQGMFDLRLGDDPAFAHAAARARAVLDHYDATLTTVRTNCGRIAVDWGMTVGFMLSSVLHQCSDKFDFGLFALDHPYEREIFPRGNNSITNHFLSGAKFPIRSNGGGWSRPEKVAVIGREAVVRDHLRVCNENRLSGGGNCGKCEKCIRTRLDFLAAGLEAPALGPAPSPEEVASLKVGSLVSLVYFEDLLDNGRWESNSPVRCEIERMVTDAKTRLKPGLGVRVTSRPVRGRTRIHKIFGINRWRRK